MKETIFEELMPVFQALKQMMTGGSPAQLPMQNSGQFPMQNPAEQFTPINPLPHSEMGQVPQPEEDMAMSPQARGGLLGKFGGTGAGKGHRGSEFGASQYQDMSQYATGAMGQLQNAIPQAAQQPWKPPSYHGLGMGSVLQTYLRALMGG